MTTKIIDTNLDSNKKQKKEKTPEEIARKKKEHKEYMNIYLKKKIICSCGKEITLSSKPYHIKTEIHKTKLQLATIKKLI